MSKGTIPALPEGYADWLTQLKPTIGLLLCKQQNSLVAEYALSDIDKPIGVAEYQLLRDLPDTLGRNLPSVAEIEAELAGELNTGSAVE